MGFFDIFSSSSKAVDTAANVVDKATTGIIAGIDKAFFTDEEKSDVKQKAFESTLDFQKALMQESLPAAVSRRVLAWAITGVYLFLVLTACALWRFSPEWAKFIIENGIARVEFAFGAVISTYFIYHGLRQTIKKK